MLNIKKHLLKIFSIIWILINPFIVCFIIICIFIKFNNQIIKPDYFVAFITYSLLYHYINSSYIRNKNWFKFK